MCLYLEMKMHGFLLRAQLTMVFNEFQAQIMHQTGSEITMQIIP